MSKNKPRLKGYYLCKIPCCSEFICDIPLKQQKCPYCGKMADRIMYVNAMDVLMFHQRRIHDAIYYKEEIYE